MATSGTVVTAVGDVLRILREGCQPEIRSAIDGIIAAYGSPMRTIILAILLPVLCRLRNRVVKGDVAYFAGEAFIPAVHSAVEKSCRDAIDKGLMPDGQYALTMQYVMTMLGTIRTLAQQYQMGLAPSFETLLVKARTVVQSS
jgi:hypothetical protein